MTTETQTVVLAPGTLVTVAARYDEDDTRTFELVEQIYPPPGVVVSDTEIYSGVYVWKCAEVIKIGPGAVEGRSLEQYAVKFYNPTRVTQLDIPEEERADFFFNTEDYMDRQIRGLSPALAEIVGVAFARLAPGTAAGDYDQAQGIGLRRFSVITTPNDSTDFLAVKNNLIVTKEDLGEVPLGMQYLLRVAMSQLCEALDTMHISGVYHQDIKTENMVLGSTGGWSFEESVKVWNRLVEDKYRLGVSGFRSDDNPWSRDIDTNVLNLAGSIALEMLKIVAGRVPDGTSLGQEDLDGTSKRRERDDDDDDDDILVVDGREVIVISDSDDESPDRKRARGLGVRLGEEVSGEEIRDDLSFTKLEEFKRVLRYLVPWAEEVKGSLVAMLIDFDRGRSMNAIADMTTIGVDGTLSTLDPWRIVTQGDPDLYEFAPSTPQQQLRAAFHGSDLWSMGITMYEMANLSNPFDENEPNQIAAAFGNNVPQANLQKIINLIVQANTPRGQNGEIPAPGLDEETYKRVCQLFTRLGTGSLEPNALINETMGWDVIRPLLSFRLSDRYSDPMSSIVEGLTLPPTP